MGLTATEVGLQFDYRFPVLLVEALESDAEEFLQTICDEGAAIELDWIGVFRTADPPLN